MPKQPYQRRSHDAWQRLITEQQQSGHSQRDFCTANNLALSSFRNWKRAWSIRQQRRYQSLSGCNCQPISPAKAPQPGILNSILATASA